MNESNGNLETSPDNKQSNSQAVNTGEATETIKPPRSQRQTQQRQTDGEDKTPKPKSLAELFGNSEDESSTEIDLEEKIPDDPDAPLDSIERLMKRNKLTPEQAYAIKVPMPNGAEALTIGELKDKISTLTDFEMQVTEFDDRRVKAEGELLKGQAELNAVLQLLPKEAITEKVLAKVRESQDRVVKRERAMTLQHIPSWADDKKRDADISTMQNILSEYGFDESFLHSIVDHRAIKFVRDAALMRMRVRKSLEDVRNVNNVGKKPSPKTKGAPVKPNITAPRVKVGRIPTQQDKLEKLFANSED